MRGLLSVLCCCVPVATGIAQSPAARQAVVAARLRLDTAIAAKDTAALAALLASDAILVRRGDTVRGAPAIAAWVAAGIAGVPEVRVNYAPDAIIECDAATVDERGGDYILFLATYARTDTVRGRYAARWTVGADGRARIAVLELGSSVPGTRRSALRVGGICRPQPIASLARRRLHVTLPTLFQTVGWNTVGSVENTLRGRGFVGGQLPLLPTSLPTREENSPVMLGVRVPVSGSWSVERYWGVGAKRATIRAYREADSSYVTATYEGRHHGMLVGYERGVVRIGTGPAVVRQRWTIEETELHATYDTLGLHNGWASTGVRGTKTRTEVLTGLVAQATVVLPLPAFLYVEGRAQLRRFPRHSVPTTGRPQALSADHGGYTLSLSFGGAW